MSVTAQVLQQRELLSADSVSFALTIILILPLFCLWAKRPGAQRCCHFPSEPVCAQLATNCRMSSYSYYLFRDTVTQADATHGKKRWLKTAGLKEVDRACVHARLALSKSKQKSAFLIMILCKIMQSCYFWLLGYSFLFVPKIC